ncbi:sam dependent methyltransferase [Thozetella sp. PMI_491]|nr:sam dependent methyltransferase [Thozetella sp. PMI_491]
MTAQNYPLPHAKDGDASRLNLQHRIFRKTIEGRLLNVPLSEPVGKVLEIGAGSGIWASEFASENPTAEIVGIDLFQPPLTPPSNCRFVVLDAEKEWDAIGEKDFDLVHTRMVLFHMKEVAGVLQKAFDHLKPGGKIEVQEMWLPYITDEPPGALEHSSPVVLWGELRAKAAEKRGLNQSIAAELPQMLAQVGFVDVQVRDEKWPIGPWMDDDVKKEIGEGFAESMRTGMLGFSRSLMTKELGMTEEQLQEGVKEVVASLGKGKIYTPIRFAWARKPE